MTFQDVKVFAGDKKNPPADASYKNLLWENVPIPDILFNVYTPTIVSLDKLIDSKFVIFFNGKWFTGNSA